MRRVQWLSSSDELYRQNCPNIEAPFSISFHPNKMVSTLFTAELTGRWMPHSHHLPALYHLMSVSARQHAQKV